MSKKALASGLIVSAWLVPVVWVGCTLIGNEIGSGWFGMFFHLVTWPLAWAASLFLGAAGAIEWCDRRDLRLVPRILGTAFGAVSALGAFPLGLVAVMNLM